MLPDLMTFLTSLARLTRVESSTAVRSAMDRKWRGDDKDGPERESLWKRRVDCRREAERDLAIEANELSVDNRRAENEDAIVISIEVGSCC